jgi:hypothetical protein
MITLLVALPAKDAGKSRKTGQMTRMGEARRSRRAYRLVLAWQPCRHVPSGDRGHWLCVAPFRVSCPVSGCAGLRHPEVKLIMTYEWTALIDV